MKNLTKEGKKMNITITYSLWHNGSLLSVGNKANSADEMLKTVNELKKVSSNVVAHMRKVEKN